jgi:hypothetical protein
MPSWVCRIPSSAISGKEKLKYTFLRIRNGSLPAISSFILLSGFGLFEFWE